MITSKQLLHAVAMIATVSFGNIYCQNGVNLVPNPSFGEIENCSTFLATFTVLNWYPDYELGPNQLTFSTPDLYHSCNNFQPASCNAQPPLDSDAYAGLLFQTNFTSYGGREFMAAELISPLQAHQNYCISFYKNYCDSPYTGATIIDNFSVGFFNNLYPFDANAYQSYYSFIPENITDTILYDTVQKGWQKVEHYYIANGNENYVLLGWLEDYTKVHKYFLTWDTVAGNPHYSYIFLDSIVVMACHNELGMNIDNLFIPNVITANGDGLNDDWILHQGDTNIPPVGVEIYNRWGTLIYKKDNYQGEWHGQTQENKEISEGVYYYRVTLPPNQQRAGFVTVFK